MAQVSVEKRAASFAGFMQGFLKLAESEAQNLEPYIADLLKIQDKITRHACADEMDNTGAHSKCMNCLGGLIGA